MNPFTGLSEEEEKRRREQLEALKRQAMQPVVSRRVTEINNERKVSNEDAAQARLDQREVERRSQVLSRDSAAEQQLSKEQIRQLKARDEARRTEINKFNETELQKKAIMKSGEEYATVRRGYPKPKEEPETKFYTTSSYYGGVKRTEPTLINNVVNEGYRFDLSKYKSFNADLNKDITNLVSNYSGLHPNQAPSKIDLWEDIIKPHESEDYVETRLNKIAAGLREGEEGFFQSIQEGWWEREIQNMLSKEHLKRANGEPNKVDLIEKWYEEHPEITDFVPEDMRETKSSSYYGIQEYDTTNIWYDFKTGATRQGFGGVTRLGFDLLRDAALDPETYAWTLGLTTASMLAAPATGGASLVTLLPLDASAPMLASQLGTAAKTAQSLSGITGITMGMRFGTTKQMATMEMVGSYQEMVDYGVDPVIASRIAPTIGVINGLLEQAQWNKALQGMPAVKNLITNAKKQAMSTTMKSLMSIAKEYGATVSQEVLEETLQGMVTHIGTSQGLARMDRQLINPLNSLVGGKASVKSLAEYKALKERGLNRPTLMETARMNAYEGLKTFWAMPLGSTAVQSAALATQKGLEAKQIKGITTELDKIEEVQIQEKTKEIKSELEMLTGEGGIIEDNIEEYRETNDPSALAFLLNTKENFKANQNKGFTKEQKAKMIEIIDEIESVEAEKQVEAKNENPDIDYLPTNRPDLEAMVLSDAYESKTKLSPTEISYFNQVKEAGVLNDIRAGIQEGKLRTTIEKEIRKKAKLKNLFKMNKAAAIVERMKMIVAVEEVDAEISRRAILNARENARKVQESNTTAASTNVVEDTAQTPPPEGTEAPQSDLNTGGDQSVAEDGEIVTEPAQPLQVESETEETGVEAEPVETLEETAVPISTLDSVKVTKVNPQEVKFDPDRFQFRYERGNVRGADNRLEGVDYREFNAGVLTLWMDEHGDLYVVNGHHRLDKMIKEGVTEANAKVLSHEDFTPEQARAVGAGENIAEGNATSIDVAKVIRDTSATKETLVRDFGVPPNSKIVNDGVALSRLNERLFNKAVTKALPIERAVIIGKQLGGMDDAQNTLMNSLAQMEAKGKTITNNVLSELIAHARGMKQDIYEEQTLFGTEQMVKDYSVERAELVSYVKTQLNSKKNLLKNVSKEKNAAILEQLGNAIAVDENVKDMEVAEQAVWILDKTVNYPNTTTNTLFNELAKEYAEATNKMAVKKKALELLLKEMEGNKLLDEVVNQKAKRQTLIDDIKSELTDEVKSEFSEGQQDLLGQAAVEELQAERAMQITTNEAALESQGYKETIGVVEAMSKNPVFNGLTVNYTGKSGDVTLTKEELIKRGYEHYAKGLKKGQSRTLTEAGSFDPNTNTITLNLEGTRDTILEEAIHYIQQDLQGLNPLYAEAISDWEAQVRELAEDTGVTIPQGKELLAQAIVFSEMGYADQSPALAELIAVDKDIMDAITDLMGKEIMDVARGESFPKKSKINRFLNVKELREVINFQTTNTTTLNPNTDGTYAQLTKMKEGYKAVYFNNQFGKLTEAEFDTLDEAIEELAANDLYQLKVEGVEYDRSVADELHRVLLENGEANITGEGYRQIREGIITGNFVRQDFDDLVRDNPSMIGADKVKLEQLLDEAEKKGIHKPNSEVTLKEYLYRFDGKEIAKDSDISLEEVKKNYLYHIDSTKERIGTDDDTRALENIAKRLKSQHKYFQDSIDTYRRRGLQYQLRPLEDKTDTPAFKDWFLNSAVVHEDGTPRIVYHGTTHRWSVYSDARANMDNDMGKGLYATSEYFDAQMNYLADGADMRARISNREEQLYDAFADNPDYYEQVIREEYGINDDTEIDVDDYDMEEVANLKAENELMGEDETIMGLYLSMQRPFSMSKNPGEGTYFEVEWIADEDLVQELEELRARYDEAVENDDTDLMDELEWEIEQKEEEVDESREPGGAMADLLEAIRAVSYNYDGAEMMEYVLDDYIADGISAYDLVEEMKRASGDIYDYDTDQYGGNQLISDVIKYMGYDGIIYENATDHFPGLMRNTVGDGVKHYIVFNPTQIKSIDNIGTFSPNNPDINYQLKEVAYEGEIVDVEGFYSKLEEVVRSSRFPNKGVGADMYNLIKKTPGVKPEELDWFKMEKINNQDKYTRDEVLALMAESRIQINKGKDRRDSFRRYTLDESRGLGKDYAFNIFTFNNPGEPYMKEAHFGNEKDVFAHNRYLTHESLDGERVLLVEELQSDLHSEARDVGYLQVMDKEEHRNLLILREDYMELKGKLRARSEALFAEIRSIESKLRNYSSQEYNRRWESYKEAIEELLPKKDMIISNETLTEEVKRELLKTIDDNLNWYDSNWNTYKRLYDTFDSKRMEHRQRKAAIVKEMEEELNPKRADVIMSLNEIEDKLKGAPNAPLKDSWVDFLFKSIIKDAVEGGHDGIAWTTGAQQAVRWSKDVPVETYVWQSNDDGTYYILITDENGAVIVREPSVSEDTLEEKLGKKIADHIKAHDSGRLTEFSGNKEQLGFYGSLYDNYLPRMVKKYTKKWGVKLEEKIIRIDDGLFMSQPYIEITDAMRQEIMEEKQPLFQLKESKGSLMAQHNITEGYLRNALRLGGFPAISIAVTRPHINFQHFGEISLIFNKDTIEGAKLWSGDKYTPTFPTIYDDLDGSKFILDENENKLPPTLENIAKVMSAVDTEDNPDPSLFSSLFQRMLRRFDNIDHLREYQYLIQREDGSYPGLYTSWNDIIDEIIDTEGQIEWIVEDYQNAKIGVARTINDVAEGYKTRGVYWRGEESKMKFIKDAFRRMGIVIEDGTVAKMYALYDALLDNPTEYFEAKTQRVIDISEIQAVVAPDDISPELEAELRSHNIHTISKYEADNEEARKKAVGELTGKMDILFQIKEEKGMLIDEYYEQAQSTDEERLSWVKTVAKDDKISQELKDLLTAKDFMYTVMHNKDTMLVASRALQERGERFWIGIIENKDTIPSAIEFAISQILTFKYMESGQTESAMHIAEATARKAKDLGQAIQVLSVLGRQTPEGMLRFISGYIDKLTTSEQKELLDIQAKDVMDRFQKLDEKAKVDFKEGLRELDLTEEGKQLDEALIKTISDLATRYVQKRDINLKDELAKLDLSETEVELINKYIVTKASVMTQKPKEKALKQAFKPLSYERDGLNNDIIETALEGDMEALKGLLAEKTGLPIFTTKDAEWIYERSKAINEMENGTREKDVAIARLMGDIANLIPTSMWHKVSLIQTMAQLMNAKTILRNLIGNGLFGIVDTVTLNYLGAGIDKLLSIRSGERTILHRGIFKLFTTQMGGYRKGFALGLEDAKLGIDTFDTNVGARLGDKKGKGNKYDIKSGRTFESGAGAWLEKNLNITMRATDRAAFMASYMDSIEEQMAIAGVTTPTEDMMTNATALGLYRTFNDSTKMAEAFRSAKRTLNTFSSIVMQQEDWGLGDLVLKYPKTPANILQRMLDYSPIGLFLTMLELKKNTDASGYLRQRMIAEAGARAITGTNVALLGMLLGHMGILTGASSDEPEKMYELRKQEGMRDYGVNVSALNRYINGGFMDFALSGFKDTEAGVLQNGDLIVSYDWIEPMGVPLAVGVDFILGKGDVQGISDSIAKASLTGINAITSQPLLTGLTQLFGYGDVAEGTFNVILGAPASFTPTLLGHITNTFIGENKDPYTAYSQARIAYNKIINKTPLKEKQLPNRYSTFGEKLMYTPEDEAFIAKIFRNIISPAFYDRYSPDDEVLYIIELYEASGDEGIIPKTPQEYYTFDGERFYLTPEEYSQMSKWLGEQVKKRIAAARRQTEINKWNTDAQVEEVRHILNELGREARLYAEDLKKNR